MDSKPTGKGERLIIMNVITKNGWVDGTKTGDVAKLRYILVKKLYCRYVV